MARANFGILALALAGSAAAPRGGRAWPDLETLLRRAVAGLEARDTAALAGMSFGREEFLRAYPHFETDTSRSRREFACGYFLSDNRKLLGRALAREGGSGLRFARFAVDGPVEDKGGLVFYRGLRVWVTRGGKQEELRFIKSAAKTAAGFKIWSFADD